MKLFRTEADALSRARLSGHPVAEVRPVRGHDGVGYAYRTASTWYDANGRIPDLVATVADLSAAVRPAPSRSPFLSHGKALS